MDKLPEARLLDHIEQRKLGLQRDIAEKEIEIAELRGSINELNTMRQQLNSGILHFPLPETHALQGGE